MILEYLRALKTRKDIEWAPRVTSRLEAGGNHRDGPALRIDITGTEKARVELKRVLPHVARMVDLCLWLAEQPDEPDAAAWGEALRLARSILDRVGSAPEEEEEGEAL